MVKMKVQTQTITTYVANDGTSFNSLSECRVYERSKLPLYKRIAIEQEFMWYNSDQGELSPCGCEDSDLTDAVRTYTFRVIYDALQMQKQGKTADQITEEFGLI